MFTIGPTKDQTYELDQWMPETFHMDAMMLNHGECIRDADYVIIVCTRSMTSLELSPAIESLRAQSWPHGGALCIVVNAVQDLDKSKIIPSLFSYPVPVWITFEATPGYASARNAGIRVSLQCHVVIFLDDDTILETDWIKVMLEASASHPSKVLGSLHDRVLSLPTNQVDVNRQSREIRKRRSATLSGSNGLLIPVSILGDLRFDEEFNMTGGEDTDLLLRLSLRGHDQKIVDCIALEIDRFAHQPFTQDAKSAFRSGQLWIWINEINHQETSRYRAKAFIGLGPALIDLLSNPFRPSWLRRRKLRRLMRRLGVAFGASLFKVEKQ